MGIYWKFEKFNIKNVYVYVVRASELLYARVRLDETVKRSVAAVQEG